MPNETTDIAEARQAGFDLSLVEASLALSPEQRAEQHDAALALVLEFDRIRQTRDADPASHSSAPR